MIEYKAIAAKAIAHASKTDEQTITSLLEMPKDQTLGDLAFPCFSLAKQLKASPIQIATSLASSIQLPKEISHVKQVGPYLNIFFNKSLFSQQTITEILDKKESYGKLSPESKRYVVEYPGPNTNKPLHLGHAKVMFLGKCITTLLRNSGHTVFSVNINNDRGVHICKSMLAYKKWAHNAQPNKKSDHFVADWYVRYAKEVETHPELENEIQVMLEQWEQGNLEVRALWKKMNDWALEGHHQTYKAFNIVFDKEYYESEFYDRAREVVLEGVKSGVFQKREDGAVIATFPNTKLPDKVILRANGTTVYITQDIYLAQLRYKDFTMDSSVYIVGNEQNLHFQQLFAILKQMKQPYADLCYHLSSGMIELPTGKMKSREGTVVDADDLLIEVLGLAQESLRGRYPHLDDNTIDYRADIIAKGALRFFIFKHHPKDDFVYDPQASISFEGETGPYMQYTYARIQSILRKEKPSSKVQYHLLIAQDEKELITLLAQFSEVVDEATIKYSPNLICQYLVKLCQTYNKYYHAYTILKEEEHLKNARLALSQATAQVIKNALALLNIEVLEEM